MSTAEAILNSPVCEAIPRRRKRIITDLRWARRSNKVEAKRKLTKVSRSQREGIRFEQRLGRGLLKLPFDEIALGVWFTFEDANGLGFCQADALAVTADGRPLVIEVKLTQTQRAVREVPVDDVAVRVAHVEAIRDVVLDRLERDAGVGKFGVGRPQRREVVEAPRYVDEARLVAGGPGAGGALDQRDVVMLVAEARLVLAASERMRTTTV